MNNWTIGKKLAASFLAVAAITLALGIGGYYGALKSNAAINEIGNVRLPSVQSLLIISENAELIKAAQRTLLIPNLPPDVSQRQIATIGKARSDYEAAWKIYAALPQGIEEAATWKEFIAAWQNWRSDNNEFFKMNAELEAMGISDPTALARDLFEVRGTLWKTLSSLSKQVKENAVLADTDVVNTLLVDSPNDWTSKITTSNPQIQKAIQEIQPLNAALLASVRKVRETHALGGQAAAREMLDKDAVPKAMKIIELMRPIRAEIGKVSALREKLDRQLMTVCRASQNKAIALLDKLVEINATMAADSTKGAISQATALEFLSAVGMVAGVALALALGFFITRSLVKILTLTAESLSEGSDQVASASGQISSASQSLAEGASEQAASLEET
ncbi:MAG: MCP four helix bundle domain-containing protein, partial [Verrucomicrobiae bacterium]